tara:strand:- start:9303 stop:10133 length:831 start_codon:yes stop_codon:yes gene_type:complete
MKNKYLILFTLLQLAPFFGMGQTSVMSFNIRYDNLKDYENWWGYRKSSVVELFDHYSPEIIGIQEGHHHQVKYIEEGLPDYGYIGAGRDDGETKGEYAAIFYRKEQLKLLSSKTYWLSETPEKVSIGWDASMERIVTFGEFLDKKTNEKLFVFNCHFDHLGPKSREKSADLILKIIREKNIENGKLIVMGDFNSLPESEPIKIFKSQLEDAYEIGLNEPYGPSGTFNGFNLDRQIRKRIDYILTKNIEVIQHTIIDDRRANNLFISDHLPVMVKIK